MNRHSFVSGAPSIVDFRRPNECKQIIGAVVVIKLSCPEQKRSKSWTAWSQRTEDFVGGACKGVIDSCIGELVQMIDWKVPAPTFAAGRQSSVQAVRERRKLKSSERGNAGQTVLTKMLALAPTRRNSGQSGLVQEIRQDLGFLATFLLRLVDISKLAVPGSMPSCIVRESLLHSSHSGRGKDSHQPARY